MLIKFLVCFVIYIIIIYIFTTINLKTYIMKALQKSTRFFRNEAIGTDFTFDFDIEVFVSLNGDIEDYSGCSFEKATKLISLNK